MCIRWTLLVCVLSSCAVPVPPSGGPPDTSPPSLLSSQPADGEVGVSTDRVTLRFDEYLDERSLPAALTVTPAASSPPEIRFGGRELQIRFTEPLRDSTTYILTLDSGFRDAHGVALEAPIRIAFSTGPEIDRGKLAGRVVEWDAGKAAAGIDVFAYDEPLDADQVPAYRSQTDREGRFSFAYLPARPFFVVAVRDVNRNQRIDPGEWIAVPPARPLVADTSGAEPALPWVLVPIDREPPELRRADGFSPERILARFSEPVTPRGAAGFAVRDSVSGAAVDIRSVHADPSDARTLVVRVPSLGAATWLLGVSPPLADSSGNAVVESVVSFAPGGRADTTRPRLLAVRSDSLVGSEDDATVLAPGERPTLVFDDGPEPGAVRRAVSVRGPDGQEAPFDLDTADGLAFSVVVDRDAFDVTFSPTSEVAADSVVTRRFRRAPASALGELSGTAAVPDSVLRVVLVPAVPGVRKERIASADVQGRFRFDALPGDGRYRFRLFLDLDRDGRWSPGRLDPYESAEPIGWADGPYTVRARWDTAIPDTLRIGPTPADVPPAADAPDS